MAVQNWKIQALDWLGAAQDAVNKMDEVPEDNKKLQIELSTKVVQCLTQAKDHLVGTGQLQVSMERAAELELEADQPHTLESTVSGTASSSILLLCRTIVQEAQAMLMEPLAQEADVEAVLKLVLQGIVDFRCQVEDGTTGDFVRMLARLTLDPKDPNKPLVQRECCQIGRGQYTTVWEATVLSKSLHRRVAVKIFDRASLPPEVAGNFARKEVGQLAKILSPTGHCRGHLLNLVGISCEHCAIVTELCDRNLKVHITRNVPILEQVELMYQVAKALCYVAENNIVHRNVKLSNILIIGTMKTGVQKSLAKLGDFGLATARPVNRPEGSLVYMAPEARKNEPEERPHVTDMYAYGSIMQATFSGTDVELGVADVPEISKWWPNETIEKREFVQERANTLINAAWSEASRRPTFATALRQLVSIAREGLGDGLEWLRDSQQQQ